MDTLANVKARVSQEAWEMVTDAPFDSAMSEGLFDSVMQEMLDSHQWYQWRKTFESVAVNIDVEDTETYLHVLPPDAQYIISVKDENCCKIYDYRVTSDGVVACVDTVIVEYTPTLVCGIPKMAEMHLLWALVGRLIMSLTVNAQGQATTDELANWLKGEFMFVDSSQQHGYSTPESTSSTLRDRSSVFGYYTAQRKGLGRGFRRF